MSCPYCGEEHGCDNPGCEEADLKHRIDTLSEQVERLKLVATTAQGVLTALNVGNVESESLLHKKLREVMIEYRKETEPK